MGNHSITIELELAWSNKSSSYFENNFPIFLLYGISNTSIFNIGPIQRKIFSFALLKAL